MWFGKWSAGATTGVIAYTVVLFAITAGMSAGLSADSVSDARITPDEYTTEPQTSDYEYDNPVLPESLERDDAGQNQYVQQFTENVIHYTMQIASDTAVWAYYNKGWISPWWAEKSLTAASYAGILGYFGVLSLRLKRIWEVLD